MENKMSEVAKLLGVELDEEFGLKNSDFKYKLTTHGLRKRYHLAQEWSDSSMLDNLLLGRVKIVKAAKPILDNIEKNYLSNIIKPFRDRIDYIAKINLSNGREYIFIKLKNYEIISLPFFTAGTMYKGMENDKDYTLKDLGL